MISGNCHCVARTMAVFLHLFFDIPKTQCYNKEKRKKRRSTVESQQQKYERMTKGPVGRTICSLAVPCIISMLVTSFYNMADTFFVGMLKSNAATELSTPPLIPITTVFAIFVPPFFRNFLFSITQESKKEKRKREQ